MNRRILCFIATLFLSPALFAQSVPQNVVASQVGNDIQLNWSVSADNVSYQIYLDSFFLTEVSGPVFTDSVTPTTAGATYFVTGCNAAGVCSQPSLSAVFEPGVAPPPSVTVPQVQNVRLEVVANGVAVLSWDPVVGAEKYNIDKNLNYLATTGLTSGTLRDTNLDLQGLPQFELDAIYRVSAVDDDAANNFGPWSLGVGASISPPVGETDPTIASLEATIADRDATISMLESEISTLQALVADLQAQIATLTSGSSEPGTDPGVPSDL